MKGAEPFVMPANQVTKAEPELRSQSVILSALHSKVPMLTSTLATFVTAWRGDPAIFLSITGGDILLAHDRREWRRSYIVDENTSEGPWHSNAWGLTAWVMDRGRGEEELLKFRAGMENKVIRLVWHDKDTSDTRRMKISQF